MTNTDKRWTMAQIRAANEAAGRYFFSRDTMKCFGDTMKSFAVRHIDGGVFIERVKPMRDRDGKWMGGLGQLRRFDPETGDIGPPLKGSAPTA